MPTSEGFLNCFLKCIPERSWHWHLCTLSAPIIISNPGLALNVLINPALSLLRDVFSSINFSKRPHYPSLGALQMSGLWQRKPLEVNTSLSPETGIHFPLPNFNAKQQI